MKQILFILVLALCAKTMNAQTAIQAREDNKNKKITFLLDSKEGGFNYSVAYPPGKFIVDSMENPLLEGSFVDIDKLTIVVRYHRRHKTFFEVWEYTPKIVTPEKGWTRKKIDS